MGLDGGMNGDGMAPTNQAVEGRHFSWKRQRIRFVKRHGQRIFRRDPANIWVPDFHAGICCHLLFFNRVEQKPDVTSFASIWEVRRQKRAFEATARDLAWLRQP